MSASPHAKPEEIARLLHSVGITHDDMWDPKGSWVDKAGVTHTDGNTNDLVKFVYTNPGSNAILIHALGREDMRLEWMVILTGEFDPDYDHEQAARDMLAELKRRDAEGLHDNALEGVGQMTAGQYMDAMYDMHKFLQWEPRERLAGIRRGQYIIAKRNGDIPSNQTFKQFCEGDYWLVDVKEDEGLDLSPKAQADVNWYFKGCGITYDDFTDESLDLSDRYVPLFKRRHNG